MHVFMAVPGCVVVVFLVNSMANPQAFEHQHHNESSQCSKTQCHGIRVKCAASCNGNVKALRDNQHERRDQQKPGGIAGQVRKALRRDPPGEHLRQQPGAEGHRNYQESQVEGFHSLILLRTVPVSNTR